MNVSLNFYVAWQDKPLMAGVRGQSSMLGKSIEAAQR
jgi:hypothetical protein